MRSDRWRRWGRRAGWSLAGLAAVGLLVTSARLGALEADGPPHLEVTIHVEGAEHGLPATLYVPGDVDREVQLLPDRPPEGDRPPIVVLAHGFVGDRASTSTLARSLTHAGYVVVAFDFRGHGVNRNPFDGGGDALIADVTAAVDYAVDEGHGDPDRVAVMGHSMGAGATLQQSSYDDRVVAAVPISGGYAHNGPETPERALFIWAEDDPSRLIERAEAQAAILAEEGAEVVTVEVSGEDHFTIIRSEPALVEMVEFLDESFDLDRTRSPSIEDDRRSVVALHVLALLIVLLGTAGVTARVAPLADRTPVTWRQGLSGLGMLAAALVVAVPLVSAASPLGFVGLVIGEDLGSIFLIAAASILGLWGLAGRGVLPIPHGWSPPGVWRPTDSRELLRCVVVAGAGVVVAYLGAAPLGGTVHNFVPTPERLVAIALLAAALAPFTVLFHQLTRRGSWWASLGLGLAGRLIVVLVLVAGVALGVLPDVVSLGLFAIVGLFVLFEATAAASYLTNANPWALAMAEALTLAWILGVILPIGF